MARRSLSHEGTARVAVVGSGSIDGAFVRAALAERGVPGSRVDLYGTVPSGEAVLSEYDGEARLIQDPDPREVGGHEVVFLCEPGEASERLLSLASPRSVVIDLGRIRKEFRVAHAELLPPASSDLERPIAVPHSISVLLAELLHPLDASFALTDATAVVLRPAADFGEGGLEELREQTIRLLSFEKPPTETFGRQLAFNVIPQHLLPGGDETLERRVAEEVAELLGWNGGRLALRLLTVPLFYGHGVLLRVRPGGSPSEADVTACIAATAGLKPPGKTAVGTPMEAAVVPGKTVSRVSEDGAGGFWLWAVLGDASALGAAAAVSLAALIADL
jgi:aspartate-semialdehyde dehydrogenase